MSQRLEIPFTGPTLAGRSGRVNAERTVNLYPVVNTPTDKGTVTLYADAGTRKIGTAGNGARRSNGVSFLGDQYYVNGTSLVRHQPGGAIGSVGTLASTPGRVTIAAGFNKMALADGQNVYTWDGSSFTTVSSPPFTRPTHITYLDGYFMVNDADTDDWYLSAINDPTSWAAADVKAAEARGDGALALTSNDEDVFVFGNESYEVYTNNANPDFPFERYAGGVGQFGIAAPHSLVASSAGIFWLASVKEGGFAIMQMIGTTPQRISPDWLGWELEQLTNVADAWGFVANIAQRWRYQLTLPGAERTYVYDLTSQMWYERESYGFTYSTIGGHGFIPQRNLHVVGDARNTNVNELTFDVYTENDQPLVRSRRTQVVHRTKQRMTFNALHIDMETGVGLTAGQGSAPVVSLRYSDDGGDSWSDWIDGSLGAIGERHVEIVFYRLGTSRQRIFEIRVSDPVETVLIGAHAEISLHRS